MIDGEVPRGRACQLPPDGHFDFAPVPSPQNLCQQFIARALGKEEANVYGPAPSSDQKRGWLLLNLGGLKEKELTPLY